MEASPRCLVCRRSATGPLVDLKNPVCDECFGEITSPEAPGEGIPPVFVIVQRAARRSWQFADALLDVSPKRQPLPRGGDPGPSRWKAGRRRR